MVVLQAACTQANKNSLASLVPATPSAGDEDRSPVLGVKDESGRLLDLRATRGKVVLVDFWASWCNPCLQSLPFYRRLSERWGQKGLLVVGVNVDDQREAMLDFMAIHPLPFSVVFDQDKKLMGRFGILQLPTTFLFDRKGRLRKSRTGFDPEEARAMEDEVRLLLGEGM